MKYRGKKLTPEQKVEVEKYKRKAQTPTTERERLKYDLCEQVCIFLVGENLSIEDLAGALMLDAREAQYILDFNYSALNLSELSSVPGLIDSYYNLKSKLTPDQKDLLAEMKAKLASGEMLINHTLPDDASIEDREKYELCGRICEAFVERKLTYKELAEILDTDETRAKQIVHYQYIYFSLEELRSYCWRLNTSKSIASRATIDSLDLCDFFKREVMGFFVEELRAGRFNVKLKPEAFNGATEVEWVLMCRTDKMTLDRLLELKGAYLGTDERAVLRGELIPRIVSHPEFSEIKLNATIRGHLVRGGSELITADFLVNLLERLGE